MATDGPTPNPCDANVYQNGTAVCVIASISSNRMERFIQSVATQTNQAVDWHFVGGRAVVKALGDIGSVVANIRARASEVGDLQQETGGGDPAYRSAIYWLGED